jgi:hypothetical protein
MYAGQGCKGLISVVIISENRGAGMGRLDRRSLYERTIRGGAGTLIAPQWAVTAAHVGQDLAQDGSHSVSIGGASYTVEKVEKGSI